MREVRRTQPWLGTIVEITVAGAPAKTIERGMRAAFAAVAEVHRLLSFHDPNSELSHLNREAATRAIGGHPWTWRVLHLADRIAEKSAGIFDPTIAPRLTALDFLPRSDAPIAKPQTRWSDVHLGSARRVRFTCPLWLDLGVVAKGFAVDRAIEALRDAGVPEGLVNAGGDLRAFGPRAWPVHLRAPDAPGRSGVVVDLQDAALATSALYFFTLLLLATGLAWWGLDRWAAMRDEFGGIAKHPAQPGMLRLHGAGAFGFLVVFGSLIPVHIKRGLQARQNRVTGLAAPVLLIAHIVRGHWLRRHTAPHQP